MSVQRREQAGRTTWVVRWRESGAGTRQRSKSFSNKKDAEIFWHEVRRRQELGAFAATEPSATTLDDWLARWWTQHSPEWSANTVRVRRSTVEKWIVPYLGQVRLRDLGTARVIEWRQEILREGAPPIQTNRAMSVLSSALGRAVEQALLPANPCSGVRKVGRQMPTRPKALTPAEIEAIRAELPTPSDRVAWGLMAYAGLRPAEALAARWGDLEGPILVVDAMKTLRRRAVEIIEPLRDDIEALRPSKVNPMATICTAPAGGPVDLHNWRERAFRPACARAGMEATPYNGRTSYCSLLIHEGRSLAYVAASMGNSARVISDHYLHVLRAAELGMRRSLVDAVYEARQSLQRTPDVRYVCSTPGKRHLRLVS